MLVVVHPAGQKADGVRMGIRMALAAVVALGVCAGCSVDTHGLGGKVDAGALGVGDAAPTGSGGRVADAAVDAVGSGGKPDGGGVASGGLSGTGGVVGTGGATLGNGGVAGTGGALGGGGMKGSGGVGGDAASGRGGTASSGGAAGGMGGAAGKGGHAGSAGGKGGGGAGGGGGAAIPVCDASTCANGCCMGTTCVRDRTVEHCGMGGVACAACDHCFKCSSSGSCELDPASTWNVICGAATIESTQANGTMWDPSTGQGGPGTGGPGTGGPGTGTGTLPDPVCQFVSGVTVQRQTAIAMDTLMPAWNAVVSSTSSAKTLMSTTSRWSVTIVDDDGGGTFVLGDNICQVTPSLTVEDFSTGKLTFENVGRCVTLSLQLVCAM